MTKLTQVQFKDKKYTVEIISNGDIAITAIVYPLHPSSNEYQVINKDCDELGIFPATTQGFKDAIKVFNEEA